MEKKIENKKEVFAIHIDGPDVDDINEALSAHELTGFLVVGLTEEGACVCGRDTNAVRLAMAMDSSDVLRKAASIMFMGNGMLKLMGNIFDKKEEDADGKEE